jgi:hypothetical protein
LNSSAGDGLKGRRGSDVYVRVPCGTMISERIDDIFYQEDFDEEEAQDAQVGFMLSLFML